MDSRQFLILFSLFSLVLTTSPFPIKIRVDELSDSNSQASSSPFSVALQALQKQIGYNFQNIGLLRRAMTHPSFSEENNRALSILGFNLIETSLALRSLQRNIEISSKDLNHLITEISKMESCAVDALRLGLEKVIRVSEKTNSSMPVVVCGGFRAIFGAIAVDTGKADDAGTVFMNFHRRRGGGGGEAWSFM